MSQLICPTFSDQLCVEKWPAMETAEAMERVVCARESWRTELFPGLASLREETCCTDTRYMYTVSRTLGICFLQKCNEYVLVYPEL